MARRVKKVKKKIDKKRATFRSLFIKIFFIQHLIIDFFLHVFGHQFLFCLNIILTLPMIKKLVNIIRRINFFIMFQFLIFIKFTRISRQEETRFHSFQNKAHNFVLNIKIHMRFSLFIITQSIF